MKNDTIALENSVTASYKVKYMLGAWSSVTQSDCFVTPFDCSPSGSSVREIFLARILEWVGVVHTGVPPGDLPDPGIEPGCPALAGRFFTIDPPGNPLMLNMCVSMCLVTQSCLTLCSPMDWIPPGSSVHGLIQARILQWVAMASSRGSLPPRDGSSVSWSPALQADSLPLAPPGKPKLNI